MNAELIRIELSSEGIFGILKIDGKAYCVTLELPFLGNSKNISSIPKGNYKCKRYSSVKYPDTFEVMNVTNRSDILFHAGNTISDTHGCILLGANFGKLRGNRAILNSGATFATFMQITRHLDEFELLIKEV